MENTKGFVSNANLNCMHKAFYSCLLIAFHISCNSKVHSEEQAVIQSESRKQFSYVDFMKKIAKDRMALKNADAKTISIYFFSLINNDIAHYWNGTPWDFNGTTRMPKEGAIACGYFVTNTLTDVGFKIQRTKLAQMASSQMIQQLCVNVKTIAGFEKFKEYISNQPSESVYIVGLDFHTGYIIKDANDIYFLHSNYINREGVMKEKIEDSRAFQNSKIYVVGSLSANKKLLNDWLKQ